MDPDPDALECGGSGPHPRVVGGGGLLIMR